MPHCDWEAIAQLLESSLLGPSFSLRLQALSAVSSLGLGPLCFLFSL